MRDASTDGNEKGAHMIRFALLVLLLLAPTAGLAQPGAVELLQPPAWIIRGETQVPLTHDASLRSGDIVRTGVRARVRIGLAEGGDVKIGPSARVELPRLRTAEETGGIFEGIAEIVRGAFRYTTGATEVDRGRDLEFRVGTVTAGIRGTDIWGKAADDRDFVVLIEGEIEVGSGGRTTRLDRAGTAYIQPRDGEARSGVEIDSDTIAEFAQETEPVEGRGRLAPDGAWQVMLDSLRAVDRAERARARYREAGYPVVIERARVDGRQWHRIVLPGAASRDDARAFAEAFEADFGVIGAWVRRAE
jgi:hypothetical protein